VCDRYRAWSDYRPQSQVVAVHRRRWLDWSESVAICRRQPRIRRMHRRGQGFEVLYEFRDICTISAAYLKRNVLFCTEKLSHLHSSAALAASTASKRNQWRRQDLVPWGAQKLLGVYMKRLSAYSRYQALYRSKYTEKINCCKSWGRVPQCPIAVHNVWRSSSVCPIFFPTLIGRVCCIFQKYE